MRLPVMHEVWGCRGPNPHIPHTHAPIKACKTVPLFAVGPCAAAHPSILPIIFLFMHQPIPLSDNPVIHSCVHPSTHSSVCSVIHASVQSSPHHSIHPSIHPLIHPSNYHPLIHPPIKSITHSFNDSAFDPACAYPYWKGDLPED